MTTSEEWLNRWKQGRTGWHEVDGNKGLKEHWPDMRVGGRVLVPLCGKTPDLKWLADRGLEVVGVELSEVAARAFFEEQGIEYKLENSGDLVQYTATDHRITLYCGDYFRMNLPQFDALYDRGALIALSKDLRQRYFEQTKSLLKPDASRLIITLEYDQQLVKGPPYSVLPEELKRYWPDLVRVQEADDLENCPPKFRAAGITEVTEVVWRSPLRSAG